MKGKPARVKLSFAIYIVLTVLLFSTHGYARQQTSSNAQQEAERRRQEQQTSEQREKQKDEFERLRNLSPTKVVSARRNFFPFKPKRTAEQEKRLLPNAQDLNRHEAFLRQPKTGLIRLVPDAGCEANTYVVRADDACLNNIPGGSYYSFREREHTSENLSDIRLEKGFFVSDGVLSQGILVALGNVPLENLSTNSEGISFLTAYQPEIQSEQVYKQFMQIASGMASGRYYYRKSLPVIQDMTYAMRVIAYRGKLLQVFRGRLFDVLSGDQRADLIIAFRVVRTEADGSANLLWKELDRREAPKVVFPKSNKR